MTVASVDLLDDTEVRKHLRSRKTRAVYVCALCSNDTYYVKVSKAEALYQLREHGSSPESPIAWTIVDDNIYIEPNRS